MNDSSKLGLVSVIIVNWNTRDLLFGCIRSIYDTADVPIEIIVVDNDSSDGSASEIEKQYPDVNVISSKTNLGFAAGNNLGLRYANGEYVLLLNPDTLVKNGTISQMRDFLAKTPTAGAVGARLLNKDGSDQECYWMSFPDLSWLFTQALYLNKLLYSNHKISCLPNGAFKVAHVLGACFMMRRSELTGLGGFDESYFLYLEETDLLQRVKASGLAVYHLPDAQVVHFGQQSSCQQPQWTNVQLQRSMYQFLTRNKCTGPAQCMAIKLTMELAALVRLILWSLRYLVGIRGRKYAHGMLVGYARLMREIPRFHAAEENGMNRKES